MRWQRLVARAIGDLSSICRSPLTPRKGLRILMYHSVGSVAHDDRLGLFSIDPVLFEKHVDIIAKEFKLELTPLEPLNIDGKKSSIAITFDDGYRDNLIVAAPILLEKNIPFSVFVTANFIKNSTPGFLSPRELRELANMSGVQIGAHGVSHTQLTHCNDKDLEKELVDGKHYLEDQIGKSVTSLAYPHGDTDLRVRNAVESYGYTLAACSHFDINHKHADPLLLSRCTILGDDDEKIFRQKLIGGWDWYRFRDVQRMNMINKNRKFRNNLN